MIQISSSAGVLGNANGVKIGAHCLLFPKQRSAVLRLTPRGSNPTRSNRARTSSVKRKGPAKSVKSTPEPPGPPGFRNSEPIRAAGLVAGRRTSASEIVAPFGWS